MNAAVRVQSSFNARRDALSREYRYAILNSPIPSPLQQRYTYSVPGALDVDAMNQACKCLIGSHDLASFAGAARKNTVREVCKAEVSREGELVFFDIVANSFLYKQVRCTVGSLIRVGLGKLTVGEFQEIMLARRPGLASPVAPPEGLCLVKVNYSENKLSKGQLDENL